MTTYEPHPANVPGDFYVENGCCTTCDVPRQTAPELFALAPDGNCFHCYVAKQPETPVHLEQMIDTIRFAELQCIRYRGRDRAIQTRLVQLGEGPACDQLPDDLQKLSDEVVAAQEAEIRQRLAKSAPIGQLRLWWKRWRGDRTTH